MNNSKLESAILDQEIVDQNIIIDAYKELIHLVLRTSDISNENIQNELITYQNEKNEEISLQNGLKRKRESLCYERRIDLIKSDYQILSLYEELLNQKTYAENSSLFLTLEEKNILLKKLKDKFEEISF